MRYSPHQQSERGQSLIIVALLMVGMIAALGLALDGGNVFASRRKSQNAADAAAFAGVRLFATKSVTATESSIWGAITKLAAANGITSTTDLTAWFIDKQANNICTMPTCGGVPTNATGVRVTTRYQMQPYFIDVLIGKNKIPINAIAAVQSGPPVVGNELMPMSIKFPCTYDPTKPPSEQACGFQYSYPPNVRHPYRLFGEKTFGGGFQWTSYDCQSNSPDLIGFLRLAKTSGEVLADPYDTYYNPSNPTQWNTPPPDPNPWVCSGPGVKPDAGISAALDCWLFPNGSNCWMNYGPAPREYPGPGWTVPVFDVDNGASGAGGKYHTVTFAEFDFQGYWFANNQCNWIGKTTEDCGCTNDPAFPSFKCKGSQQPISPDLEECLVYDRKCLMGYFLTLVQNLEITPGQCNNNGLDICGVGMSQ